MTLSSQERTTHLSEDALDNVLLGLASASNERHLAACEGCACRLAEFRTTLAMFNEASAAWSHARSNTITRQLTPRRASHAAAAWSLASVGLLAVAVSLTSHLHRSPEVSASADIALRAADGQQEIANDNAMLAAIDSKLSEPVHSPVATYGSESVAAGSQRSVAREVRD